MGRIMKSKAHASVRLVTSFGRAVMASAKIGLLLVISLRAGVARAQNSSPSFAMAETRRESAELTHPCSDKLTHYLKRRNGMRAD